MSFFYHYIKKITFTCQVATFYFILMMNETDEKETIKFTIKLYLKISIIFINISVINSNNSLYSRNSIQVQFQSVLINISYKYFQQISIMFHFKYI